MSLSAGTVDRTTVVKRFNALSRAHGREPRVMVIPSAPDLTDRYFAMRCGDCDIKFRLAGLTLGGLAIHAALQSTNARFLPRAIDDIVRLIRRNGSPDFASKFDYEFYEMYPALDGRNFLVEAACETVRLVGSVRDEEKRALLFGKLDELGKTRLFKSPKGDFFRFLMEHAQFFRGDLGDVNRHLRTSYGGFLFEKEVSLPSWWHKTTEDFGRDFLGDFPFLIGHCKDEQDVLFHIALALIIIERKENALPLREFHWIWRHIKLNLGQVVSRSFPKPVF
ncbi:hypothetical protein A2276_03265 [candidate division WOR-1 bacterium RIFOXYA12_FULL_43_27]|uniref:Uncharacterized protein n=1 Tax=candidate division WOR-1 bacterium RIFOXYC2_FULL_46_14 TaxID=1802587 RepID=A0A1F4U7R9_UNCSA|nr:MAG: hypothetical protein A2276_03265 [candidate division WOR-1 bacterium RIFOXYA12_FULL_43_27]OGC19280.1 MAG: hypothetical protein A2292_01070 [candidate division WOR-1 bacterium RIFOXYB2_FULL_46_45]OGC30269.1 MAG: hypothetical protein A2232_01070 [candidate division WOR-1 bacterium RIFOXYA2_FULL_46_56]OGC40870.1 MAG: hypothetical protein A2438_01070 [candidate division WOR-1 bacterium RIFOXYC2_FULL_46_14]